MLPAKATLNTITRREVRQIFRRNRGSAAEMARILQVSPANISMWLRGRKESKRIADAMTARALELRKEH